MAKKDRTLYVLKYLWKNTDEDHPATVSDIIAALAEEANSPGTGDTGNPALWISLLLISGGIITSATVVSKKKKRSVK